MSYTHHLTLTLEGDSAATLKRLADAYGRDPVDMAQTLLRDALRDAAMTPPMQGSATKDIMRLAGTMPKEEADAILATISTLD